MPGILFAEVTVSTSFMVIAYLSIIAMAVLIIVALFDPGLRYKVSAAPSQPNDSDEFLQMLEALVDAKVNQNTQLTVLTNGPTFYEAELEAIRAEMQSPEVVSDGPRLHACYEKLQSAEAAVHVLYARWAELEGKQQ